LINHFFAIYAAAAHCHTPGLSPSLEKGEGRSISAERAFEQ